MSFRATGVTDPSRVASQTVRYRHAPEAGGASKGLRSGLPVRSRRTHRDGSPRRFDQHEAQTAQVGPARTRPCLGVAAVWGARWHGLLPGADVDAAPAWARPLGTSERKVPLRPLRSTVAGVVRTPRPERGARRWIGLRDAVLTPVGRSWSSAH